MERITSKEMKEFLKDWEVNSEIELLEEGKNKNDIIAKAKAKGYNLKDNKDLAGFKCTYAFANKANRNGARLPQKVLLKALPTMIGKPVNIDHQRRYVVGHYIDYSYNQKENKVTGYGVIYKSNFDEEWEEARELFSAKKLTTSYEIWCPKNKRRHLTDGTYELLEQEIAGGAILFKEEPAFKDAKVLELAMKRIETDKDLVFASTHNEDDLIIADEHISPIIEKRRVKCSNCNSDFEAIPASEIKCPSCLAIVNAEGNMIYPPQKKDFQVMCPGCKSSHWKILSRDNDNAKIECLNESCKQTYKIAWAKDKKNADRPALAYLYIGRVTCLQCGKTNEVLSSSQATKKEVKCKKCGLLFSYDIKGEKTYRKIDKIEKIDISKTSEKGGNPMKDEKKKVEASDKQDEKIEKKDEKLETKEAKEDVKEQANVENSEAKKEDTIEQPEVTDKEEKKESTPEEAKEAPKAEEKVESQPEKAEVEKYPKTKALRKAVATIRELKKSLEASKEDILKAGIKKVAKQLIEAKKETQLYKENAKTILTRKAELGDTKISDEDILNDDKFEKAKLEIENAKLKAENDESSDVVGIKEKGSDYYANKRKEISRRAFGHKDKE